MNHQFDELTKSMAQSVTRRGALKKFGLGLAGMALACLGLASKAEAAGKAGKCSAHADCPVDNPYCCKGKRGHCTTYTCPSDNMYYIDLQHCITYCPPF